MTNVRAPIVVGVDGSEEALRAVHYAAREATWRQRPLRIVHAFIWPLFHVPLDRPAIGPPEAGLRNQAHRIVKQAMQAVATATPDIDVDGAVVTGAPAAVLTAESRTAEMIVIGDRGLGGFTGLLVGSVAVQTTVHATCPVHIVKGDTDRTGPVVVGVDGSPLSGHAIDHAIDEAAWRDAPLRAVHAWQPPALLHDDQHLAAEPLVLAESLAGRALRYPDVAVEQVTVADQPASALLRAAADAQLVVVGARGRGGFTGLLFGSTSHAVLHHAPCPTAIVRP